MISFKTFLTFIAFSATASIVVVLGGVAAP